MERQWIMQNKNVTSEVSVTRNELFRYSWNVDTRVSNQLCTLHCNPGSRNNNI